MLAGGGAKYCPFQLMDEAARALRLWQVPADQTTDAGASQGPFAPFITGHSGDVAVIRLRDNGGNETPSQRPEGRLCLIFDGAQLRLRQMGTGDRAIQSEQPKAPIETQAHIDKEDYMYIIGDVIALWRDFS